MLLKTNEIIKGEEPPLSVITHTEITHTDGAAPWVYLCRFATYWKDEWNVRLEEGCYGTLTYGQKLALQFRVPSTPEYQAQWRGGMLIKDLKNGYHYIAQEYLAFLLDTKISPWRSVCHIFEPVRDADGYVTGLVADDCAVPRAMLHNLCIAIRMAWEMPSIVTRWHELVSHGLDPVASLYYAMHTSETHDKKNVLFFNALYHTWSTSHSQHSLTSLDHPPTEKLSQILFTTKTKGTPTSNHVWACPNHPPTKLGKEFPKELVTNKLKEYWDFHTTLLEISKEDFLTHVIEAAETRRKMEKK